uniref:CHK kinase-like domain-containing protein n=1 Tax=Anopheles farauti TaxID=69004 RepID=A0A182QMU3_9DIPT
MGASEDAGAAASVTANGATIDTVVPEYINDRLIERSLVQGLGVKRPRIVERSITRATANGDNYMSDVFRIAVRYVDEGEDGPASTRTLSLVVKSLPDTGQRGHMIEEIQAYEKEVCMFQEIVPKLARMTNDAFFAARCFYASDLPERLLVFEDLKTLGYATANRQAGLDFDHCALVMRKIGQFHAASMRFAEQEPELLRRRFNFNMFNPAYSEVSEHVRTILEKGLETLIEVARNQWDGFDQSIVAKMEQLAPVYVDRLRECLHQDSEADGGYRVLNHGDLWSNNMMFRYGNGPDAEGRIVPQDVAFVDLQISFYTSPGVDLNYALANCPNYDTRSRLDELIGLYHASFKATLERLAYDARPIPTLADVRREIRRMEFFALVSVISILPIVLMDQTDEVVADFENLVGGEEAEKARQIQYNGVNYQRIVRPMLIEFNKRKLLDV